MNEWPWGGPKDEDDEYVLIAKEGADHVPQGSELGAPQAGARSMRKIRHCPPGRIRSQQVTDGFVRETFTLPLEAARAKAQEIFKRYPKEGYDTRCERAYELDDGRIEFTMRRLPSAD